MRKRKSWRHSSATHCMKVMSGKPVESTLSALVSFALRDLIYISTLSICLTSNATRSTTNLDNKMVGDETYCKPCTADEFDWETFKCTGVGMAGGGVTFNGYCDYVIEPPLACPCDGALMGDDDGYIPASQVFFGRGAVSHLNIRVFILCLHDCY